MKQLMNLRRRSEEEQNRHSIAGAVGAVVVGLALALLSACSPPAPMLVGQRPPPEPPAILPPVIPDKPAQQSADVPIEVTMNRNVTVVFVVDNSKSMVPHQEFVSEAIDGFSEAILSNELIDLHVGVTAVWDYLRYDVRGISSGYSNGQLRPLCGPDDATRAVKCPSAGLDQMLRLSNGIPYISRLKDPSNPQQAKDWTKQIIRETLKIGIQELDKGGPEYEEYFSPIWASIQKNTREKINPGFIRDDELTVFVILSDAQDASRISADELRDELVRFKGGETFRDRVMVVGITPSPDKNQDQRKCSRDPSGSAEKLPRLLELTKRPATAGRESIPNWYDLCGNPNDFPLQMAKIGADLRDRVEFREIFLQKRGNVVVTYAGQPLVEGDDTWRFDEARNVVTIRGTGAIAPQPGGKFSVTVTKKNP